LCGYSREQAWVLVDKMHEACPISNAILDNVYVRLAVVLTFEVSSPEMHERGSQEGKNISKWFSFQSAQTRVATERKGRA
jgi:hypothetical protein